MIFQKPFYDHVNVLERQFFWHEKYHELPGKKILLINLRRYKKRREKEGTGRETASAIFVFPLTKSTGFSWPFQRRFNFPSILMGVTQHYLLRIFNNLVSACVCVCVCVPELSRTVSHHATFFIILNRIFFFAVSHVKSL